ncbi:MAG: 4Fe-4S dicluster domain-containing protein [Acidobacteria bacterium]|nr:4Fe-4S dicluster domain-containing protein [Acidobacteriota bacterium]NIM60848.1 4Fe-4S dicluster domain-containing protein [Acidobacteriota bacterium]NIO58696.1 4Fe-4S dicluster domain-containing protein [Acidobacteriota bacterium]NIQ29752.1 4Fe-4S dicluster domain-containing protein [Acidobacteriota bacterium]NIQ87036.1 4Fe-4S dicluster domain-containing protein [Acidobacteriota bacterium]
MIEEVMEMPERADIGEAPVRIHVLGRAVEVPFGLTIMKAMEYAGFRLVRGVGCRGGFCGACSTLYRRAGDYKLRPALACQATVEDGMFLAGLPFVPANRGAYDLESIEWDGVPDGRKTLLPAHYPELARCVACNTCTKACPQELAVMDYIQLALRDDLEGVARESFDCLQCGLCAVRCPADIPHYHVAQLARRVHGRYAVAPSPQLSARVAEIEAGEHHGEMDRLIGLGVPELTALYAQREIEEVAA